jgi:hypothetical protein
MKDLVRFGILMQDPEAIVDDVTVEIYNYIGPGTVALYNNFGTFYSNPPAGGPTVYTGFPPNNVQVIASSPLCLGTTIDYQLNGSYVTSYSAPGCDAADTGNISTSNGNTYTFYCYDGI